MNELEKFYRIFKWVEDIDMSEGRKRLQESIEKMSKAINHPSIQEILARKEKITIIDICSGKGIGFVALAKAILRRHDVGIEVIAVDLRQSALEKAEEYAEKELGVKIKTFAYDVTRLWELGISADIGLLFGFSTPHFNPYDLVRIVAGMASILGSKGVFVVEESDRIYSIYQRIGYKDVYAEYADEDHVVLSIDSGRDPLKGVNKRLIMDLITGDRVSSEVRLWDIAGVASILWCFYSHVDFIKYRHPYSGLLVAWRPRGINPIQYTRYPEIVSEQNH